MTMVTQLTDDELYAEWQTFQRWAAQHPHDEAPRRAMELSREIIERNRQKPEVTHDARRSLR